MNKCDQLIQHNIGYT